MRIITANGLQERIIKTASEMDCQNNKLAKQGKASKEVDFGVFELMFIHKFLPYFNQNQVVQKECYLNEKYGV